MGTSMSNMCIGCGSNQGEAVGPSALPEKNLKKSPKDAASLRAQASSLAKEIAENREVSKNDLFAMPKQLDEE